jgi:hypothetical protein
MEFAYSMPPRVDLAANGHHAAYAVDLVPAGIQNPSFRRSHLVVFNCALWKMTLVDIDSLLVDYYTTSKVSAGFIAGEHLFIDRAGTRVWFTAGLLGRGSPVDTIGYTLAEWSIDGLKVLESVAPQPLQPLMYNDYTGTLLYQFGQDGYTVRGQSAPVKYTGDVTSLRPWQCGSELDISVLWNNDGISIHKASDGTFVWRIAEREQFETMGNMEYRFTNDNDIAISPDGNWLVLTLSHADNPSRCDLYTLRSNGKEMRRLDSGVPNGFAVISPQITQN